MSVIIDTFEIVADKQNEERGDKNDQAESSAKNSLRPVDIEAVLEHQEWRTQRLRAH